MKNPFKFGTIVDGDFFTDRKRNYKLSDSYWKVKTIWC